MLGFKWVVRIASVAAVLVIWQVVGSSFDSSLFSTPTLVAGAYASLVYSSSFVIDLLTTIRDFLIGFAIAAALGIVLGVAMARWQTLETALDPYVNALYSTPYVALAPLFVIWLGIGFYELLAVVILSSVFVILINSFAGVKNMSKAYVETGRAFGFSGFDLYRKVIFPGALPYIITGLRLGIGRGFVGVIVAELLVRLDRLGFLMIYYSELLEVAPGLAIAITLGLIGLLMTEGLKRVEAKLSPWRSAVTGG
ncbi:MAG TPA: ABC transporter permease [Nitrososphaerales archaeon]|nr:ABC transporter permease [Nitrososphaerales archaeon]